VIGFGAILAWLRVNRLAAGALAIVAVALVVWAAWAIAVATGEARQRERDARAVTQSVLKDAGIKADLEAVRDVDRELTAKQTAELGKADDQAPDSRVSDARRARNCQLWLQQHPASKLPAACRSGPGR